MKVKSFLPFYLFTFLLFCACSSIDCPVQNTVEMRYAVADTLKDTLYVWTQKMDGNDTLLLNRGVNLTKFALPVSYQHPEDMFVLYITDEGNQHQSLDTIWVNKVDIPHFESVDCSANFFHQLTDIRYTTNSIDHVTINNRNVNYDTDVTHINIGFKNRH